MNHPIRLKTIAPPLLMTLTLVCFVLSPTAKALLPPPEPDGGYPGGNTAEGINALHDVNTAVGINNTAVGANALTHDTTGQYNVAVGSGALASNTTGNFNMAIGAGALLNNTANFNLAIGFRALFMNTTGFHLTGIGAAALRNNTTASDNTAIGTDALRNNTRGPSNTAVGSSALSSNTVGNDNTATGDSALFSNTNGFLNTATGSRALMSNTMGGANTATGSQALFSNTSGAQNTATGEFALFSNTNGFANTATGLGALQSNTIGYDNTAVGEISLLNNTSGSDNVAFGHLAGHNATTGSNNVYIGANMQGVAAESNACYIASIFEQTSPAGVPVVINSNNKLGTVTSSKRFKENIKSMDKASEALFALKPVTFRYKKEIDVQAIPQFGLVAEDVEKVNADLVVRDKEGKPYTVRYDAVNAMLLNEFLKEHRKNEEQEKTIVELKSGMTALAATVKEQATQIQKVSAELELSKPAPQTVKNTD